MPYVYAAYRRGCIEAAEPGMEVGVFIEWMMTQFAQIYNSGGEVVTFVAETPEHGQIPVGLATLEYQGKIAYPHALWFPDASSRNKLEISVSFFLELKKEHTGLVISAAKTERFFMYLSKYGILRKVGKLRDWYGDKVHATLFQTVGH